MKRTTAEYESYGWWSSTLRLRIISNIDAAPFLSASSRDTNGLNFKSGRGVWSYM
ncbi:MAG TPA: hypothetical protein VKB40_01455 [Candidatus Acidoferrales bacterium]|nr:hypothetical protein [Candidatus Acidoferrales bacterium]